MAPIDFSSSELEAELNNEAQGIDQIEYHRASSEDGSTYNLANVIQNSLDVTKEELANLLDISPKTLKSRSDEDRLKPREVDRLLRVLKVIKKAQSVLGGEDNMRSWLKRSQMTLDGEVPFDLISTEAGTDMVINALGRIEHSVGL